MCKEIVQDLRPTEKTSMTGRMETECLENKV